MLIKYGAERLRIVHPSKEGSSSGQSTPNKTDSANSAVGTPQSPKTKMPRKKKSDVDGAGVEEAQGFEAAVVRPRRICDNCRIKKYKGKVCGLLRVFLSQLS